MGVEVLDRDVYQTKQGKIFMTGDDVRELAERVMKNHSARLKNCNLEEIEFVVVEGDKSDFLGKCMKIPPIYRLFLKGKKFIIVLNATMIDATAPGSHDKVLYHELFHANCEMDCLNDHDLKDFSWLIREYGDDWRNNEKSVIPVEELRQIVPWSHPGSKTTVAGFDKPQ